MIAAPLGIVELTAVCDTHAEWCDALFATLGGWVADTADPTLQRRLAQACHQHAWHATLWRRRRPSIPDQRPGDPTDVSDPAALLRSDAQRLAWYRDQLDRMRSALHEIGARCDPELDPATRRVIDLVLADVG